MQPGTTSQHQPAGFLVLLVARPGEDPLDLETRRRVFVTINRYPGLTLAELARTAGYDESLARYHVRVLEKAGLARSETQSEHRRIYPLKRTEAGSASPLSPQDKQLITLLRRPPVLRAVVALLDQGPLTAGELADACGVAASTASHHISRMRDEELIHVKKDGRSRIIHLADRDRVLHLLAEHPPPDDLVQDFVEAWDDLGL